MRLIKQLYGIDMEQSQYSKTIDKIPTPDIAISMGCDVGCPYIGKAFDDNWGLPDPTGKSDECFIQVIEEIARKIKCLNEKAECRVLIDIWDMAVAVSLHFCSKLFLNMLCLKQHIKI